jgi:hypothetical protein
VVGEFSECFCLGNANANGKVRTLQNRSADLFAKVSQIPAVPNTRQVTKSFIDTVNFDARTHFLQRCHYPVRHVCVQLVVTAEANNPSAPEKLLLLEKWLPHGDSSRLGLGAARDYAAVVI